MKRKYNVVLFCLIIVSLQAAGMDFKECRIGGESSGKKIKADCTIFSVAENRENPSRMIDLNIAIVRSKATKKKLDPVIMLAGGPGQSAIDSYIGVAHAFRAILKDRDVVLVDQRGTGKSNPIQCEFDENLQEQVLADPDLIYPAIENCVENLDADTRYYTTTESIKDLEEVRQALDVVKWNLIGISYGTRKALTYMKMYPNAIRSVILDGVVPQQEALASSQEKNLILALNKQFEQCTNQPDCQQAFGDVEQQMWDLLERIEQQQPTIRLQNFLTGEYDEVKMNKESVALAIRMFSYSANTMSLLPLMIDKANHGQLETIASQANMMNAMLQGSMSHVELSIVCAEDVPFHAEHNANNGRSFFGNDFLAKIKKTCSFWPHIQVDKGFKDPVSSDLPVLLLSGELDPVTPPAFAELTLKTLSHSQHLIAKGQGHNVFPLGCMPDIITDFFNDPEQELEIECMNDFDYTPFFINMMGPKQ